MFKRPSFILLVYTLGMSVAFAEPPLLRFIENKGQLVQQFSYSADIPGGNVCFTPTSFHYLFYDTKSVANKHQHGDVTRQYGVSENRNDNLNLHYIKVSFDGALAKHISGLGQYATNYNYFYGSDPDYWIGGAKSYESLVVCDLYQGIDLEVYSDGNAIKYDLIVRPGVDPGRINMTYEGYEDIQIDQQSLYVKTSVNEIQELRPYAYQLIDGNKVEVPCYFDLDGGKVSFDFPVGYDESVELVIDPILIFSTYSGSMADNWGNTATFGEDGKLYSGGITNHFRNGSFLGEFPATPGAFQTSWSGVWDVAVLKYDSAGRNLEYATYLGGSGVEVPHSIIMNDNRELVIYGTTNSTDFPVDENAFQRTFGGGATATTILGEQFIGGTDTFVTILSQDGSELVASTYFGGTNNDGISPTTSQLTKNYGDQHRGEVFFDHNGNILIAGTTSSSNLFDGLTTSFNTTYSGGNTDGFLVSFSTDLSQLNWGGYVGGSQSDVALGIKVDQAGNFYATGGTNSDDFNMPENVFDGSYNQGIDGWVVKIHNNGDSLISGTFLGTSGYDQSYFIDLDSNGDVFLYGQTDGAYPNTTGLNLGQGQFVQKYDGSLSQSIYSFTFGGSNGSGPNISPTAFLVNDCDNLYVAGWGNDRVNFQGNNYVNLTTAGMPTTPDAFETTSDGEDFYLMVMDASASTLLYATFFGTDSAFVHVDGGTSRFDKSGIVYHSVCASCNGTSNFPTTEGAVSRRNGSGSGCNNASFKFDLASLRADFITNTVTFDNPGVSVVCIGDPIVFENKSIGGVLYEWGLGDDTEVIRNDTTFIVHEYSDPGIYNVVLRASDPNTCISEDFAFGTVQVVSPAFNVMDDTAICFGDGLRLVASGAISYDWVSEDSTFISNERTPLVNPEEDMRYFVRLSSGTCQDIDTVDVRVIPQVNLDLKVTRSFDCWTRPSILLENNDPNQDAEFLWSLGDGNTTSEDSYTHEYERDGMYNVTLTAVREFCIHQQSFQVNITTIRVPNVITPTITGDNDSFIIEAPAAVQLSIFNEWGKRVYQSGDYQNDWTGDGLAAGVYYYEANIIDETSCKGWVQLVK